jgi:hypothetical protein
VFGVVPGDRPTEDAAWAGDANLRAKGYVTLVFDPSYRGESSGEPRDLERRIVLRLPSLTTEAFKVVRHHLAGFTVAYCAAIGACAATLTIAVLVRMATEDVPLDRITLVIGIVMGLVWGTIGAGILAAPAIVAGYPVCVLVARSLRSRTRTAIAGGILGPIIGTGVTLALAHLQSGLGVTSWTELALFLTPPAIVAGAAMGWTVATRERRTAEGGCQKA